jgi:hypothetical protein
MSVTGGVEHLLNGADTRSAPDGISVSRNMAGVTMMRRVTEDDARAEALFVTDLQRSECPTPDEIRAAVSRAMRRHGGVESCAALVALEFGEHPECAVARMQWARQAILLAYPPGDDDPGERRGTEQRDHRGAGPGRQPTFGAA